MFTLSIPQTILEVAAREVLAELPTHIRFSLNGRLERGIMLAAEGAVMQYKDRNQPSRENLFQVRSSNPYQPPFSYLVDLAELTCECPDFENGYHCKHLLAAQISERSKRLMLPPRYF